jgi:hypothetical protein
MVTNLEVVRAWYDSGNPDLIDPQIEWLIPKGYPGGGNYYGRDAVFNDYFPKLLANFDRLSRHSPLLILVFSNKHWCHWISKLFSNMTILTG